MIAREHSLFLTFADGFIIIFFCFTMFFSVFYLFGGHTGAFLPAAMVNAPRGGRMGVFLPAAEVNVLRGGRMGVFLPAAVVNVLRGGRTGAFLPAAMVNIPRGGRMGLDIEVFCCICLNFNNNL